MKTIEQARAAYAAAVVEQVRKTEADKQDSIAGPYRRYARQFGTLIHTNGLGQALAFARSKGSATQPDKKERAWNALYQHFSDWLTGTGNAAAEKETPKPLAAKPDALDGIAAGEIDSYMLATVEAMALAVWIKRLAEAVISEDDDE